MPATISLAEGTGAVNRMRAVLMEFPEVVTVTSQQGRPDSAAATERLATVAGHA